MDLSKTDIHVLEHIRDNAGQMPTPMPGKMEKIEAKRFAYSRQKLLDNGMLTPARKNGVIISNKGISALNDLKK
ncbi:hypothetical protein [Roseivirga seohaensis]|uniref:hypothetical protein n=1 Tax=Roseivirga seohaensis TaxID=1914963 RepID=UPI003BA954F1